MENRLDDITREGAHVHNYENTDDTVNQTVTRSWQISKLHVYAKHFPYIDNAQIENAEEGRWMKPCYYDDHEMVGKLS